MRTAYLTVSFASFVGATVCALIWAVREAEPVSLMAAAIVLNLIGTLTAIAAAVVGDEK